MPVVDAAFLRAAHARGGSAYQSPMDSRSVTADSAKRMETLGTPSGQAQARFDLLQG